MTLEPLIPNNYYSYFAGEEMESEGIERHSHDDTAKK